MDRKRALKSCLLFPWAGTSRLMTGGNYYIRQEIVEEGGRPKGGFALLESSCFGVRLYNLDPFSDHKFSSMPFDKARLFVS